MYVYTCVCVFVCVSQNHVLLYQGHRVLTWYDNACNKKKSCDDPVIRKDSSQHPIYFLKSVKHTWKIAISESPLALTPEKGSSQPTHLFFKVCETCVKNSDLWIATGLDTRKGSSQLPIYFLKSVKHAWKIAISESPLALTPERAVPNSPFIF